MVLAVAFLEFRVRRLVDVGQLSHGLRVPVVGTMPRLPARAGRALPHNTNSSTADAHRLMIDPASGGIRP